MLIIRDNFLVMETRLCSQDFGEDTKAPTRSFIPDIETLHPRKGSCISQEQAKHLDILRGK